MIHIATVHWQTDQWIDIQLQYLRRFLSQPYKVYSFLNSISKQHYSKFFYVCDEPIENHSIKLNLLAEIICLQAKETDILLFIDGDAFPISPLYPFLETALSDYPLTAIVRSENLSDIQPHPSFCATTVGLWKELKGDWKKGYTWKDSREIFVSDVGGNLLQQLEKKNIPWLSLYRSQSLEKHPLWYGIYHEVIYHHGAGFRPPSSRKDIASASYYLKLLQMAESKSRSIQFRISNLFQRTLEKQISRKQLSVHDRMYDEIVKNANFFLNIKKNDI